jgi:hypothetical protein
MKRPTEHASFAVRLNAILKILSPKLFCAEKFPLILKLPYELIKKDSPLKRFLWKRNGPLQ